MNRSALRTTLPYVVGLAIAALLFHFAQKIEYTPRHGTLGPAFWPEAAIALMAITCLFEIARGFLGFKNEARGVEEIFEGGGAEAPVKTYPMLLVGGIALVTVYAFVVDYFGFLLSTFFFLAAFMYLGRYRRHLAIWLTSLGVTFGAALLFMRIAYVSLPRGVPPFDAVTDIVRTILGG